jgi:hypothetical protein
MNTLMRGLAVVCLFIGFLILAHQYVFYEVWFEVADIHHETVSIAFVSFGLGLLLGTRSSEK